MKPVNSFTRKPEFHQIASYILVLAFVVSYYFITFPLSSNLCKIVGATLETIFGVTMLISGFIVSHTDPSDPCLKETIKARREDKLYVPVVQQLYCDSDSSFVTETSKHCSICNRCTEDFDHHCRWLNNDVGKQNYRPFLVLIFSLLAYLSVYVTMSIILTVNFAYDSTLVQNEVFLYGDRTQHIKAGMIILWILTGLATLVVILDSSLVLLHMFLIKKGLTTFQYIVLAEGRKEYKREMELAKKALGEKERTRFEFVLCLNRKRMSRRGLKRVTMAPSNTTSDATLRGLSSSCSIDKLERDLELSERKLVKGPKKDDINSVNTKEGYDTITNGPNDIQIGQNNKLIENMNEVHLMKSEIPWTSGNIGQRKSEDKGEWSIQADADKDHTNNKEEKQSMCSSRELVERSELQNKNRSYESPKKIKMRCFSLPLENELEEIADNLRDAFNKNCLVESPKNPKGSHDISLIVMEDNPNDKPFEKRVIGSIHQENFRMFGNFIQHHKNDIITQ